MAEAAKRQEASQALAAEVTRLARLAGGTGHPGLGGLSEADRVTVLAELLTAMPVYRAYVVPGEPAPPVSAEIVARAAGAARPRLPQRLHAALDAVADLVLGNGIQDARLIVAFQQVCGPVMAKGVEDTAFYRWSRLVALNEVGGDPDTFGISPEEFHAFAARLARDWPATMTTLSTHDTKRQEDVRARLAVLAEIPEAWAAEVTGWQERAAALASGAVPDPDTAYLMWQTLAGAWPLDRERLTGYLRKAMREAKNRTSWTDPDPEYESQVLTFAELVLDDDELTGQIGRFVAGLDGDARANALGAKLVQLTMPGVADTYQGCELAGLRLVDPDNREPADFARRRNLLTALDAGEPPAWTPRPWTPRPWTPRPWTPRSCWSRRPRCDCAGSTRTGSRGSTPRCPPRARRRGTRSATPAAATRSPWSPGCPPACAAAAAGPAPRCPCRTPAPGGTC